MPSWGGGDAPKDLAGDVDPDATAPVADDPVDGEAVEEASSGEAAARETPGTEGEPNGE